MKPKYMSYRPFGDSGPLSALVWLRYIGTAFQRHRDDVVDASRTQPPSFLDKPVDHVGHPLPGFSVP